MIKKLRLFIIPISVIFMLIVVTTTAYAQSGEEPLVSQINTVWVLIAAFLVFFMQAGFGLLEAVFVRSKNVVNIMAENLMDKTATTVGFIIAGFGLMFGAGNIFFGTEWFFLQGIPDVYSGLTIPILAFFFFQFAFSAAASTIASGLMAERTDFRADLTYSFLSGLLIYPIFGHWVWGGGWLSGRSCRHHSAVRLRHTVPRPCSSASSPVRSLFTASRLWSACASMTPWAPSRCTA